MTVSELVINAIANRSKNIDECVYGEVTIKVMDGVPTSVMVSNEYNSLIPPELRGEHSIGTWQEVEHKGIVVCTCGDVFESFDMKRALLLHREHKLGLKK